jgi:hypothetical protein
MFSSRVEMDQTSISEIENSNAKYTEVVGIDHLLKKKSGRLVGLGNNSQQKKKIATNTLKGTYSHVK